MFYNHIDKYSLTMANNKDDIPKHKMTYMRHKKIFLTCYVVQDSELRSVKYHSLSMDQWVDYDPMIIISSLIVQLVIVLLDLSYLLFLPTLAN